MKDCFYMKLYMQTLITNVLYLYAGQGPFSIVFEEMFILEKRADLLDYSRKVRSKVFSCLRCITKRKHI